MVFPATYEGEMGQGRDLLFSPVSFFTLRTSSQKGEFKLDLPFFLRTSFFSSLFLSCWFPSPQ